MNLYQHQENASDFIMGRGGSGALFMDCGTGKTAVGIDIYRRCREKVGSSGAYGGRDGLKLLVVCPVSLIEGAWAEDIVKFSEFKYLNCRKDFPSATGRAGCAIHNNDIFIINYEAFITRKRFDPIVDFLVSNPVMLICDESSRLKSHTSKTTKALHSIRSKCLYRIVMSGTPAPNSPVEYWGQMELIAPGVLHKNFFGFRNTYFHLQRGEQVQGQGAFISKTVMREMVRKGWGYEITQANLEKMLTRMRPEIFHIRKEDCLDLPPQVDEIRYVDMTNEQSKTYRQMKRDLITEVQSHIITAEVALTKVMKMREILSGFVYTDRSEALPVPGANPKLLELANVIEEIGDKPVIIWCQFRWEMDRIRQMLSSQFSQNLVADMSGSQRDKDESIARFKSGAARFLIAHPRSAAHGLTFVNCSYQVFFSLAFSWEEYAQSRNRTHRIGQTMKCTYIHLLMRDTVDDGILAVLRKKEKMGNIIDGILRGGKV